MKAKTQTIRVSEKARRKLKMRSAKEGKTIIRLVDDLVAGN
jgi:hypothetical protein